MGHSCAGPVCGLYPTLTASFQRIFVHFDFITNILLVNYIKSHTLYNKVMYENTVTSFHFAGKRGISCMLSSVSMLNIL